MWQQARPVNVSASIQIIWFIQDKLGEMIPEKSSPAPYFLGII